MRKTLTTLAMLLLVSSNLFSQTKHKIYYDIIYESLGESIQSGFVFEGEQLAFENLSSEQESQIRAILPSGLANAFIRTFSEITVGSYFLFENGALANDIYIQITVPTLQVVGNYVYPAPAYGYRLFLQYDIEVWDLPASYLPVNFDYTNEAQFRQYFAPSFNPSSDNGDYYFQNGKTFQYNTPTAKTKTYLFNMITNLQNTFFTTPDPNAIRLALNSTVTVYLGFAYMLDNKGFTSEEIAAAVGVNNGIEELGYRANHLSKFAGGRGKLATITAADAQLILSPPEGYQSGKKQIKLFFTPADSVIFNSNNAVEDTLAYLKIGKQPGYYTYISLPFDGKRKVIVPKNTSPALTTGRYYAIMTSSSKNNLSDILDDANENVGRVQFSNEMEFIVEAAGAPKVTSPVGQIEDATPKFTWDPIPGVPFYWIFVSSTPFELETLDDGTIVAKGVNTVWGTITDQTTVTYGDLNPNSAYSVEASPLIPGNEYNYVVLNMYDDNDATYVSGVFGSVNSFTYDAEQTIDAPKLVEPASNSEYFGDESITFRWDPVEGANNYSVYLFLRITSFAGNDQEVDVPVWSSTTNETEIDFPARASISKGKYVWFVTANTDQGAGNTSKSNIFDYVVKTGAYRLTATSSINNQSLVGFSVQVSAIKDGISLSNPIIVTNTTTYTDSLVVGTYEMTFEKDGYESISDVYEIVEGQMTNISASMTPLPSRISGQVKNENGAGVSSANIQILNIETEELFNESADQTGTYSIYVPRGTYQIFASKPGYTTSSTITKSVSTDQVILPDLLIKNDVAYISGKVTNDNLEPLILTNVTATQGDVTQTTKSDQSGNYNFTVSSGNWNVSASKNGFISPNPVTFELGAGDNLKNQSIVLIPRANQVSGFVYRIFTATDGTKGKIPFDNVTVTATPSVGTPISVVSDKSGQYNLSLKKGSYIISITKIGYTTDQQVKLTLNVAETLSSVNFTLTPNPSSISGSIVDPNGVGISGVKISTLKGETTTSLLSGAYTISVASGTKTLSYTKSGYGSPSPITAAVTPGQNLTGINATLSPNAGQIEGVVQSVQQALSGALITATSGATVLQSLTNSEGKYSLNVQSGDWKIKAAKSGFVTSSEITVTIGPGQKSGNNNFSLLESIATINGTITSNGLAVKNASVLVVDTEDSENTSSSQSNSSGSFTVTVDANRSYNITVSKTGYTNYTTTLNNLVVSSSNIVTATIKALPSSIAGIVSDDAQTPLLGAKIEVRKTSDASFVTSTTTDFEGKYSLGLSGGSYTITASLAGHISSQNSLTVGLGQSLQNVNYTLKENYGFLTGSIKDVFGSGIANVRVDLTSESNSSTVISNASGAYSFSRLIGGEYTLSFSIDGYGDTSFVTTIEDGKSKVANIVMKQLNGSISGVVQDNVGLLLGSVSISLINSIGGITNTLSSNDGSYSFEGLAFGTYSVSGAKSGYKKSETVQVLISAISPAGVADTLHLVANNAVLTGKVTDQSGAIVSGVNISISSLDGAGSAVTNSSGNYEIGNLSPGKYRISASKTTYTGFTDSVDVSGTTTKDFQIIKNTSVISGRVVNQLGETLSFPVKVVAGALSKRLYETYTKDDGTYSLVEVESGKTYLVYSDIFKEGYINDSIQVTLASGQLSSTNNEIVVKINKSAIIGNTDIGDAVVNITKQSTGEKVGVLKSSQNGSFNLSFLGQGTYIVVPQKEGYSFSPSSITETVTGKDSVTANFVATKNSGSLTVSVKNSSGAVLGGVKVTVVSSDTTVIIDEFTNPQGIALFDELGVGTYSVRAFLENYTSAPATRQVNITAQGALSTDFVLSRNNFSITGTVNRRSGTTLTPVSGITAKLFYSETAQAFTAVTGSDGVYTIANVPRGDAIIFAVKSGFISDTTDVTFGSGGNVTQNIEVVSTTVNVRGRLLYAGQGLSNIKVQATSLAQYIAITRSDGRFTFSNLPVSPAAGDTTIYSINVVDDNLPGLSQIIRIPSDAIGGADISIADFVVPSGQIILQFSDGVTNVEGVQLSLTKPDGTTESKIIGTTGSYSSAANLIKGGYKIAVSKAGYLLPDELSTRISLEADTSKVVKIIYLPYQFKQIDSLNADEAKAVNITYKVNRNNPVANLYYKKNSGNQFTAVPMTDNGTGVISASIPAQFSIEDLNYYVIVNDTVDNITYSSIEYTVTPRAKGILSYLDINPQINNLVLRKGDEYTIDLIIRDGVTNSLIDQFAEGGLGTIEYEVQSDIGAAITFPRTNDKSRAKIRTDEVGNIVIKITVQLRGVTLSKTINATVTDSPLAKINVSSPSKRLSNRSTGLQFVYNGVDVAKRTVTLGNNLKWSIDPATSGTISGTGFFVPTDTSFIGDVTVTVTDSSSAVFGTFDLSMFAEITANTGITFSNKKGLTIQISKGSVTNPIELNISQGSSGPSKKFFSPLGTDKSYTVSDLIYNIQYRSNIALVGDSLLKPASMEIDLDESLRFNVGNKVVAYYDSESKQWLIAEIPNLLGKSKLTNSFQKFGQYSVLSENEPLGLKHLSVLPSPFSPEVAPLKIGYFLTTKNTHAYVTIKIYNVRGELVKTVLDNDLQIGGLYGSSSGEKEITWDGTTDWGTIANNGRYIIKINVKDNEDDVDDMIQVVLIK